MEHGGDIYRNKVNIDFSVSLNPAGPDPEILDALRGSLKKAAFYPDPLQEEVREALSDLTGLKSSCILAGNGASELLMAAVQAQAPKKALIFEPGFSGFHHVLRAVGCDIKSLILTEKEGFRIKRDHLKAMTETVDLVMLCDPSNPAGLSLNEEVLYDLLERADRNGTFVILDESFYALSKKAYGQDMDRSGRLLESRDRVMLIRSMTKLFSIPGIRIGYALSAPENIERLKTRLPEWNLSSPGEEAIKAGCRLLRSGDYIKRTLEETKKEREFLTDKLREQGLKVFESDTVFILIKGPEELYDRLLERGILIRNLKNIPGLGPGFFRIGMKDHESNVRFVETLKAL